ncbi:MAG: ATP-binding protein [Phycisphaerales bacterium]|nr:MAG: ATP-binding protein [Phycisphaerales bacterium]
MTKPARTPPPEHETLTLRNNREQIDAAETRMLGAVRRHGYPEASEFALRLAFEEAVINAFRHGHKNLPDDAAITLDWKVEPHQTTICVEDQGPGFDPKKIPDPTLDENLECPTGRGIMLIKAYMSEVRYEAQGRRVVMVYRLSGDKARAQNARAAKGESN